MGVIRLKRQRTELALIVPNEIILEEGMESIRQTLFYTDFLTEMSKVINSLRKADPGLTLCEQNRKDILRKIAKWKNSPQWKSSLRRKK
ncbi:MAG: hypothetical protein ACTSQI_13050 [Candidatus Helarchaeota archaeon]